MANVFEFAFNMNGMYTEAERRTALGKIVDSQEVMDVADTFLKVFRERRDRIKLFEKAAETRGFDKLFRKALAKLYDGNDVFLADDARKLLESGTVVDPEGVFTRYSKHIRAIASQSHIHVSCAEFFLGTGRTHVRCDPKNQSFCKRSFNDRLMVGARANGSEFAAKVVEKACDIARVKKNGVQVEFPLGVNEVLAIYTVEESAFAASQPSSGPTAKMPTGYAYGSKIDIENAFNSTPLPSVYRDCVIAGKCDGAAVLSDVKEPVKAFTIPFIPIGLRGSMRLFETVLRVILKESGVPGKCIVTRADDIIVLGTTEIECREHTLAVLQSICKYYSVNREKLDICKQTVVFFGKAYNLATGAVTRVKTDAQRTEYPVA